MAKKKKKPIQAMRERYHTVQTSKAWPPVEMLSAACKHRILSYLAEPTKYLSQKSSISLLEGKLAVSWSNSL